MTLPVNIPESVLRMLSDEERRELAEAQEHADETGDYMPFHCAYLAVIKTHHLDPAERS